MDVSVHALIFAGRRNKEPFPILLKIAISISRFPCCYYRCISTANDLSRDFDRVQISKQSLRFKVTKLKK